MGFLGLFEEGIRLIPDRGTQARLPSTVPGGESSLLRCPASRGAPRFNHHVHPRLLLVGHGDPALRWGTPSMYNAGPNTKFKHSQGNCSLSKARVTIPHNKNQLKMYVKKIV